MADDPAVNKESPAAAIPAAAATPPESVPVTPSAAPAAAAVADAPAAPAKPIETPVKEATPAAPEQPAAQPTLLEKFDAEQKAKADEAAKARETKPAEPAKPPEKPAEPTKPAAEAKPGEKPEVKAEPAKPEPVAYKYTLPETVKLDDTRKTELHGALDEFRANPADGAQKLIDMGNRMVVEAIDAERKRQHDVFGETRSQWRKDVMADEQIGGAGHQTAMGAIARMRDLAVSRHAEGTPQHAADVKAFDDMLRITGVGDNPVFLRMLHNFAQYFDEPGPPPPNIKPSKFNGARPRARMRDLYDRTNATS